MPRFSKEATLSFPHAHRDEAGQVEHGVAGLLRRREKARMRFVLCKEAREKFRSDLIALSADDRPERGMHVAALGAERLHRVHRRFDHSVERALPAGMRRADDAGARIGEEQHAAIGAGDAEREALRRVASASQRGRTSSAQGSSTMRASVEWI